MGQVELRLAWNYVRSFRAGLRGSADRCEGGVVGYIDARRRGPHLRGVRGARTDGEVEGHTGGDD